MKSRAYLAVVGQTLIAAATFLVAKDATDRFTPLQLSWFRLVLSGVLALAVYAAFFRHLRRPRPQDRLRLIVLGLLGVTANQMFLLFGLNLSTPLHASLLYAFTPVVVLVAAVLWLGERLTVIKVLGVALAVAGVVVILSAQGLNLKDGPLRGDLLILIAVGCWSAYTFLGKPVVAHYDPFTIIVWSMTVGALSLLPATPWVLRGFDFAAPGWQGYGEVMFLSVMTSGVAFTLWYYSLKHLDASQVAVFNNLQAPLTALLAWGVLGAVPGVQLVLGGVLVLAGVLGVQVSGLHRARRRSLQR